MGTAVAAVDFGTVKIVALLAQDGAFNRCDIAAQGIAQYDGYSFGQWNHPEGMELALRAALRAAELDARVRIREVYVSVPGEYVRVIATTAFLQLPQFRRITDEDVENLMDEAAQKMHLLSAGGNVLHRSPAWFSVDGGKRTMTPVGLNGNALSGEVSFILADGGFMSEVAARLTGMGVTVLGFVHPMLGQTLLLIPPEERDRGAIMIDAGYLNTEVAYVVGDAILWSVVLPIGGGHITADLSLGLNTSMAVAEQVKRHYIFGQETPNRQISVFVPELQEQLSFDHEQVKDIIEARMDELSEAINDAFALAPDAIAPKTGVYLVGGAIAMMRGGREYLERALNRPVKLPLSKAVKLNSPMYTSAIGMIDLVFDSIEQRVTQGSVISKFVRGVLKKS